MGVLNVTPDSFFDGGRYLAERRCGAAASTRSRRGRGHHRHRRRVVAPGACPRPGRRADRAHRARASRHAVARGVLVSIDTTEPEVAESRCSASARRIVNDVSCLADPRARRRRAGTTAALVLMHSRGADERR